MNLVLQTPHEAPYEAGKDLSVVMFCEEATTAKTCEVLDLLLGNLKQEEGRVLYQLWTLEALAFIELRELSALEAATADVVIVGVRVGQGLSGMDSAWRRRWLALRKGRPGALVLVLDADPNQPGPAREVIEQFQAEAAAGRMNFFATGTEVGRNAGVVQRACEVARQFATAQDKVRPADCRAGGPFRRKRAAKDPRATRLRRYECCE